MKIIGLFILLISSVISYSQTCVIIKRTKNAIYVGADTKVNIERFRVNEFDTVIGTFCKIYEVSKFNFVVIGNFSKENVRCAISACNEKDNIADVMLSYFNCFKMEVNSSLQRLLDVSKPYISKGSESCVSQIYFFGYQNDTSFIKRMCFTISGSVLNGHIWTLKSDTVKAAGVTDHIQNMLHRKDVWKKGIVEGMKKLIRIEEKEHRNEVGGEITILKVTKRKTRWIPKENYCTEQAKKK